MSTPTKTSIPHIYSEQPVWQHLLNQPAEDIVDIYIDLKSPHAYLAVRPTLEIARDFKVAVNFLPYTLSYQALGLSKTVGPDMQRQPPSKAANRKARMYYAAAREYAHLQGLPFRSPHRLLDSDLAHRAFLFAKLQGLEVAFAMWVYLHGWGSGWQSFELESQPQLRAACERVGANLDGFDAYVQDGGPAAQVLTEIMQRAEAQGCVGVPHYVFNDTDKDRQVGLFGREHLALIRRKYLAAGLARRSDVRAEFSHTWSGPT